MHYKVLLSTQHFDTKDFKVLNLVHKIQSDHYMDISIKKKL